MPVNRHVAFTGTPLCTSILAIALKVLITTWKVTAFLV